MSARPSPPIVATLVLVLSGALGFAVTHLELDRSHAPLFLALLAFSALSDLRAMSFPAHALKLSGSFLALVLAMVLLGGSAAAVIGVLTILAGWLRGRYPAHDLLSNLAVYALFPLAGGTLFAAVREATALEPSEPLFYGIVFAIFQASLALNFVLVAAYTCYVEQVSFPALARRVAPVLPSELVAATLAVVVSFLYLRTGFGAIVLFGVVLFSFQYLMEKLLASEQRREELERRTEQLISLQVGLMSALLHTLDLRDRMTARHSAAVARYSREIADAAGLGERDQELVHTAALLHDIGKFVFPDRILKAESGGLSTEDWMVVRMHPYHGARIVSQVEGYGPVADIVLAHHERVDGRGYPRGLSGEHLPELSRVLAVADAYDAMTARDSYRTPVSSFEAIQELRRVAGTQLDSRFVEVFARVLAGKDVRYRHGVDADFDAELALERRVSAYAL